MAVEERIFKLWLECQIIYDGVKYNLATSDFYKYVDHVIRNCKP